MRQFIVKSVEVLAEGVGMVIGAVLAAGVIVWAAIRGAWMALRQMTTR